jgi:hypothetical protein
MKGIDPYGILNQTEQPTQFGHFFHVDPPYQQSGYQVTDKISMS